MTPSPLRPLVVTPEDGLPVHPFGLDMRILLSTEASGGATSVIIASHNPGEGPPPHLHHSQEEFIFVVEGTYHVRVNGVEQTVGAGTLLFIPRGTVHSFKNIGSTVARMLDWTLPGGQDTYFQAIDALAAEGGFDAAKAKALSLEYDTHFPQA
ncbi:cupin domain-containing protein [Pseudomonas sp. B6002]|uniref:cupin domain-containing protein n=1 Tax=Pseudomonas sp. B6002 TaxID=2726978 RepID=UPI0015A406B4|nr:cupin domain-containing protein [Pseudomonas sp. B6002]NVZ53849.1 cupin domain-containing protein [Pseudomonas sp. B6002]